jgi:hypothetical protein
MADGNMPDAHGASIADAASTSAIIDAIYALIRAPEGLNELVARIADCCNTVDRCRHD